MALSRAAVARTCGGPARAGLLRPESQCAEREATCFGRREITRTHVGLWVRKSRGRGCHEHQSHQIALQLPPSLGRSARKWSNPGGTSGEIDEPCDIGSDGLLPTFSVSTEISLPMRV